MQRRFFLRSFSIAGASMATASLLTICETSTDSNGDKSGFEADGAIFESLSSGL